MLKKKCPSCAKKIERKYSFCPWCGESFKRVQEQKNFGMLGKDDFTNVSKKEEVKLPFGLNGMLNSLVKQLEKQMGDLGGERGSPKGFKIQISSGVPQIQKFQEKKEFAAEEKVTKIPPAEEKRRAKLPRIDAESKIKRLGDVIIYELSTPGVRSEKDVAITKLEQGLEVKVYSRDKCYVKMIPLKVEVIGYEVRNQKVFVELKG